MSAISDIEAERVKQLAMWTPEFDDGHINGQIAKAAACYIMHYSVDISDPGLRYRAMQMIKELWPWSRAWWKPVDVRSDLVKAGALIVAEIERLDRAAAKCSR